MNIQINTIKEVYNYIYVNSNNTKIKRSISFKAVEDLFFYYTSMRQTQSQIHTALFKNMALREFKQLIKLFNLTKTAGDMVPEHLRNTHTPDELSEMIAERKCSEIAVQSDKVYTNKLKNTVVSQLQQIEELKQKINELQNYETGSIGETPFDVPETTDSANDMVVVISDMHVGMYTNNEGLYGNVDYDKNEIVKRLQLVINYLASKPKFNTITVVNLGDSLDSINQTTSRGSHYQRARWTDREMSDIFVDVMVNFIKEVTKYSNKCRYCCVGQSNHDGVVGYHANRIVGAEVEKFGVTFQISNRPVDVFHVNNTSFIYSHGYDDRDQKHGWPAIITPQHSNFLRENVIDPLRNTLKDRVVVLKGDTHKYAYTKAPSFDYIAAPCMCPSNTWGMANFAKNDWGIMCLEMIDDTNFSTTILNY